MSSPVKPPLEDESHHLPETSTMLTSENLPNQSGSDADSKENTLTNPNLWETNDLASELDKTLVLEPPAISEDLQKVLLKLKSGKIKNVITMVGAGLSTAAGVPDFRSPGTGLFHNLEKYNLPHPEAIFDIKYFLQHPEPFFELARKLDIDKFRPTVGHCFLKLLSRKGCLLRHYTQNIDFLETKVEIPDSKILEAHGSFRSAMCVRCKEHFSNESFQDKLSKSNILYCKCGGLIKPNIVFYGEGLPLQFYRDSVLDFPECELLIVMGTSLCVHPFASLVDKVPDTCPRLLINRELVGPWEQSPRPNDFTMLMDCDMACRKIAELLGWKDELNEIYERYKSPPPKLS